ncbi:phosphogluconate dehydrogenase C-terminal domain-containing protein [Selenomonas sp. TAMA-11512]|uniref:phosphogluconate dehydrogenase C-terminal domain-containing protein n=1 Tax=Selenomonas sp. TAMA-11512 TaxID=3095337 RepID=UPI00308A156B|nr:phosphogluconate dehydrogenase C-terminal domain-containing protein [Selenomonas sp. TAMA-11512]
MSKIKVAVIGAGGKMGTRTSNNLVTHFADEFEVKLVETFPPAVERIEKERGLKVTPVEEALAFAEVVIFAVPDTLIKKLSAEYVPQLKPGTAFLILDPAAAVAKELTLRDDCTFGVAHPCHPSYFKWQKEKEAFEDRFGGEGGHQDIVMSKINGEDDKFELMQKTAKAMYRADNAFIMTSEQIAFLEPTLVEILGASTLYAMAETVDEAVRRGIPREAAVSFLTGHIFNLSANFLGYLPGNPPVSDACKVAIGIGNRLVLRDDWKRIWDDEILDKAIQTMLHPENPQV